MKDTILAILIILLLLAGFGGAVYFLGTLPPSVTALVAGAIGFLASRIYEAWRESRARLYEKKREVYKKLMAPWQNLLLKSITKKEDNPQLSNDELEQTANAAFEAILYASDDVVKQYGKFRNMDFANLEEPKIMLRELAILYKEMRKDLGHSFTSLDEIDILLMFINMSEEEREEYRKLFEKK